MPNVYETVALFMAHRAKVTSEDQAESDAGKAIIARAVQDLTNGSYLSDEDAQTAFKALIDNAMASPDDQLHALLKSENWQQCELSGVAMFRWTTENSGSLDLVIRYAGEDDEGNDEFSYSVEWAAPAADEDDD